jgi:hypothetical protein
MHGGQYWGIIVILTIHNVTYRPAHLFDEFDLITQHTHSTHHTETTDSHSHSPLFPSPFFHSSSPFLSLCSTWERNLMCMIISMSAMKGTSVAIVRRVRYWWEPTPLLLSARRAAACRCIRCRAAAIGLKTSVNRTAPVKPSPT